MIVIIARIRSKRIMLEIGLNKKMKIRKTYRRLETNKRIMLLLPPLETN